MEKNDYIYEKIIDKFDVYSKNIYGCYIIQALLTNCKDENYKKYISKLVKGLKN